MSLFIAAGFCDDGRCTSQPWAFSEIRGAVGVHGVEITNLGPGQGDVFGVAQVEGRYRLPTALAVLVDGGVYGLAPLGDTAAMSTLAAQLRVGLSFSQFAFTLGAQARVDQTKAPLLVLPSLALVYRPGAFAISLAAFERPYGPPARLSLEYGSFGLGFVPLLGFDAFGRGQIWGRLSLEAHVYVFKLFNTLTFGATLGVVWGRGNVWSF